MILGVKFKFETSVELDELHEFMTHIKEMIETEFAIVDNVEINVET